MNAPENLPGPRLSERSFTALHALACIHLECGQPGHAADYARFLLACDPAHGTLWRVLAAALLDLRRPAEALAAIEQAGLLAANKVGLAGAHLTRARILRVLHRDAEAEAAAELALHASTARP